LCSIDQAVWYDTPVTFFSPSAETPCFWLVTYHAAANQVVSGVLVRSKIVPAVGEAMNVSWKLFTSAVRSRSNAAASSRTSPSNSQVLSAPELNPTSTRRPSGAALSWRSNHVIRRC